jgi:hypothetical protein
MLNVANMSVIILNVVNMSLIMQNILSYCADCNGKAPYVNIMLDGCMHPD